MLLLPLFTLLPPLFTLLLPPSMLLFTLLPPPSMLLLTLLPPPSQVLLNFGELHQAMAHAPCLQRMLNASAPQVTCMACSHVHPVHLHTCASR